MHPATRASHSFVLEHPSAEPARARAHFVARLSVETDPADLALDLERGVDGILVVDARGAEAYEQCHIPGALHLPHRRIDEASARALPRDATIVVYCWGPGCNAATKAAAQLAELGFRVKELIGGIEYWRREGHPVAGTLGSEAPLVG